MSILEFDGIEKAFNGNTVLSSIYMKCEVGQVTGLLGRNGSGKSTLMQIVFGSMSSSFKSIRIDKKHLAGDNTIQGMIGYLPQGKWLPRGLRVADALIHFKIDFEMLAHYFPEFNDWKQFNVYELSGGYRRLLEVYLLLNSAHSFILLDEPFSGLMPKHIEDLKSLIHSIKKSKGIIISDHLYRHILELADTTYVLINGKTYLIKEKEELIHRGYLL